MHAGSAAVRSGNVAGGGSTPSGAAARPEGVDPLPPQQQLTFPGRGGPPVASAIDFGRGRPPRGDLGAFQSLDLQIPNIRPRDAN